MKFVDREHEIARLQQLLNGDSPSFVIIRGRRRIGKSSLIGKVLSEKDIYFEADRTDPINQNRQELLAGLIARAGWKKGYRYTLSAITLPIGRQPGLCFDLRKAVVYIPARIPA